MVVSILLILSLAISFCDLDIAITYPIMAFWVLLAIVKLVLNWDRVSQKWPCHTLRRIMLRLGVDLEPDPSRKEPLVCFLQYNFGSRLAIHEYTVLLVCFGLTQSRFLSSNITSYVNALSAISVVYLFGRKGVRCGILALILAWGISVCGFLLDTGFEDLLAKLELHDISFGAGYVFLYYVLLKHKWTKWDISVFALICAIILLAYKRIGLAGLLLTVLVSVMLKLIKRQDVRRRTVRIGSICAIAGCYLFVLLILEGWIWDIFDFFHVNLMGRNYYYQALAGLSSFQPTFLGLGRNACATLFTTDYAFMNVGNVHSDILRMYVECGYLLFGGWLWVYWWGLPRALEKRFGYQAMEFFVLCNLYTFVVYLTDNTELYLVNQFFYILMPLCYILYHKDCAPAETEPTMLPEEPQTEE